MTALADFQSYLLAMLGDPYDEMRWSDGLLQQALRSALRDYSLHGEPREAVFTVSTTGYEQDISSLGARRVHSVSWPGEDGYIHQDHLVDFRQVDDNTIRFDDWEVAAGEKLRIVYDPLHTIEDLDGATETTLWRKEEHGFLLLAAAQACELRRRKAIQLGDKTQADAYRGMVKMFFDDFYDEASPSFFRWEHKI